MRKADREIREREDILEVISRCDVCRLALNDEDGVPYILPLNFGIDTDGDTLRLYFHSALEGHKLDLIRRDNRAAFEMDCSHRLQYFEDKGYCTYAYESVMGKGIIRLLDDESEEAVEAKVKALTLLMDHYHPGKEAYFNKAAIPRTAVYYMDVTEITGKRKVPK